MAMSRLRLAAYVAAGLVLAAPYGVAAWLKFDALAAEARHTKAIASAEKDAAEKQGKINALTAERDGLKGQLELYDRSSRLEAALIDQSRTLRSISDVIARDARLDPGLQKPVDPDLKRGLVAVDRRLRGPIQAASGAADEGGPGATGDAAEGARKLPDAPA